MNEKPLECTSCGKLKDYGEPHSFYDCVQYLKGVIQAKDAIIKERDINVADCWLQQGALREYYAQALDTIQAKDAQIEALVTALRAYMVWEPARTCEHDYRSQMYRKAQEAIKEATS